MKRIVANALALSVAAVFIAPNFNRVAAKDEEIVLRICNWEEYIDEGGWDEDELIDLESDDIFAETPMIDEFEEWYYENYGKKVRVEYSCFGTNEELYSQLTLGDSFDLVCPSDYMIMKLMAEDQLEPLSEDFFDTEKENNYYIKGVSPFIKEIFDENEIKSEPWSKYAAGYMWGTTGFVYNPEVVSEEEASTWSLLTNSDYYRQITCKDNVRDAVFPTIGILKDTLLTSEAFINDENYSSRLLEEMNDTSDEIIEKSEAKLKEIRQNIYSFETDSGKSDMVSGKVVASLQWSGDGVYAMDQAENDDVYLNWATPKECTDLWFDGFVMLKSGINNNLEKKQAAEAFINYVSRPDNVVRNMYYIGYTSVIAGGEDSRVFEYADWCYGAEVDEEEIIEYPVGFFFSGDNEDEDYVITASAEQGKRQLSAQYPSLEVLERSTVMQYFDDEANAKFNRMWINIRCFNLDQITAGQWRNVGIVGGIILFIIFALFAGKKIAFNKKHID